MAPLAPATRTVGFWSAALATCFSLTYVVTQLAEWAGLLGSGGGAHNASTPLGLIVLLTPSLFLGPSFLLLTLSIHHAAPEDRKIWSHAAVAFATVYTVLIAINYYVQLAWVAPRLAAGRIAGLEPFLFTPFDSFLYAVDILGYSFMSLATLFAARVFTGPGLPRVARAWLTANGALLPFIALQMYVTWLIWIAALWAVTFPASTWSLALLFRRAGARPDRLAPRVQPFDGEVGSRRTSMHATTLSLAIGLGAAMLLGGCGSASQVPEAEAPPAAATWTPPSGPPVSIHAQMVSVVDHAGHALWDVEKEGRAPKTPGDWEMIAEHAVQIAAAGTLITLPGTGPNDITYTQQADWQKWARAMSDAGLAVLRASEQQDFKALVAANSQLVESCEGCHRQDKPALPSEGITHQHMHVER